MSNATVRSFIAGESDIMLKSDPENQLSNSRKRRFSWYLLDKIREGKNKTAVSSKYLIFIELPWFGYAKNTKITNKTKRASGQERTFFHFENEF